MYASSRPAHQSSSPLERVALELPARRARSLLRVQIGAILLVSTAAVLLGIDAVGLSSGDRPPVLFALAATVVLGGAVVGLADYLHGRSVGVLVRTAAGLRQSAADRAADLARLNATLRRQDRRRSSVVSTLSHELRTPLNAIVGSSRLLLDGLDGELSPDQLADVARIHDGGRRLLGIVDATLDLARLDAGIATVERGSVPIAAVFDATVSLLRPLANERGLNLEVADVSSLPRVDADEDRLQQVLVNLVGNAVKFTDLGGVRLSAEVVDRHVMIAVADTGIGVSAQDQEAIFEPFWQADQSRARRRGGTGLGLAISRRLVELMDGRIWVASDFGAGSTFYVSLPVSSAHADFPTSDVEEAACKVVLVGEDADLAPLVEELGRRQIATRFVSPEAWRTRVSDLECEVVLADVTLPRAGAWRALAAVSRGGAATPRVGLVSLDGGGRLILPDRLDVRATADFERDLWTLARQLTSGVASTRYPGDARVVVVSANVVEQRRIGVLFESVGVKTAEAADLVEAEALRRELLVLGLVLDPLLPHPGVVPLLADLAADREWSAVPTLVILPPALTASQQRQLAMSVDAWQEGNPTSVAVVADAVEFTLTPRTRELVPTGRLLWPVP